MLQPIGAGTPPLYSANPTPSPYANAYHGMTPGAFLNQVQGYLHTSLPDYAAIIDRLMAPLKAQNEAKLKALEAQTGMQKNLASENAKLQQEQLAQVHKRALAGIINNLTGRGLGSSGEKPYQTDFENQTFERATKLSANQLLAYLMQLEDQLKNAAMDASSAEQSGLLAAQNYAAQNYSPNTHYNPWAPKAGGPVGQ